MQDKEIAQALKDNGPIPAEEIRRLFEMLLKCKRETEKTRRETEKYQAMKEVMVAELTGKYALYESLFARIFSERAQVIKKDFEIIDAGIKQNNRDLVNAGVSSLSTIVCASPVLDMEKLRRMLE
ncbi:MAG: hypothetical protein FWD91_05320 [Treponema sp.]|nr:hypothetical protein [Treponema sp.]